MLKYDAKKLQINIYIYLFAIFITLKLEIRPIGYSGNSRITPLELNIKE